MILDDLEWQVSLVAPVQSLYPHLSTPPSATHVTTYTRCLLDDVVNLYTPPPLILIVMLLTWMLTMLTSWWLEIKVLLLMVMLKTLVEHGWDMLMIIWGGRGVKRWWRSVCVFAILCWSPIPSCPISPTSVYFSTSRWNLNIFQFYVFHLYGSTEKKISTPKKLPIKIFHAKKKDLL